VQQCVAEGLSALNANRATHISGSMIRLMMALIPRSVRPKMMGNMVAKGLARINAQQVVGGSDDIKLVRGYTNEAHR
jgi:hypothetical protein